MWRFALGNSIGWWREADKAINFFMSNTLL